MTMRMRVIAGEITRDGGYSDAREMRMHGCHRRAWPRIAAEHGFH